MNTRIGDSVLHIVNVVEFELKPLMLICTDHLFYMLCVTMTK
jgi:hypothetical protein